MKLLRLLMALAGTQRTAGLGNLLLQPLLLRLFRRTPMGLVGMFLLRKALAGERLFGMDLGTRRKARLAWLGGQVSRLNRFTSAATRR